MANQKQCELLAPQRLRRDCGRFCPRRKIFPYSLLLMDCALRTKKKTKWHFNGTTALLPRFLGAVFLAAGKGPHRHPRRTQILAALCASCITHYSRRWLRKPGSLRGIPKRKNVSCRACSVRIGKRRLSLPCSSTKFGYVRNAAFCLSRTIPNTATAFRRMGFPTGKRGHGGGRDRRQ